MSSTSVQCKWQNCEVGAHVTDLGNGKKKLISRGDLYVSSQAIATWPMKEAPLDFPSREVCQELYLCVDRPCFLSSSRAVGRCSSLSGIHKRKLPLIPEQGDILSPSVMMPPNLSLPEGNTRWPQWVKQFFTDGVPTKVSKLQRMCLGGV